MRGVWTGFFMLFASGVATQAQERMRFWNLSDATIAQLYLAPAGTTQWGKNQCENDRDGTVSPDERLRLTNVTPGRYDVKMGDTKGRVCIIRNVNVEGNKPYAFTLENKDFTSCNK